MNISGIKENLGRKKLKENKVKNNNRGITLIALIITIIVLLILAGISISLVVGQNGVLTRSQQASTRTKESQAQEAFELAFAAPEADYHQGAASGEITSSTGESDWITLQKISDNLSTDYKLCDSSGNDLTDLTKNVTSTEGTGIYMKKDGQVYKVTYQIISGVPTDIVAKIYDKSSEVTPREVVVTYDKGKIPADAKLLKVDDETTGVTKDGENFIQNTISSQKTKTLAQVYDLDNDDYTIGSWNTKIDGTGESYDVDAEVTFNTDLTLYAQWNSSRSLWYLVSGQITPNKLPSNVKVNNSFNTDGSGQKNCTIIIPENNEYSITASSMDNATNYSKFTIYRNNQPIQYSSSYWDGRLVCEWTSGKFELEEGDVINISIRWTGRYQSSCTIKKGE